MTGQRPSDAEAEVSRALRQASHGYEELPEHVGDRLDRVLDSLPPADTLHAPPRESAIASWTGRLTAGLRPKRVRYALASAAAAVLVTVGGVAAAVQFTAGGAQDAATEVFAEEDANRDDAAGAEDDSAQGATEETQSEANAEGFAGVATFASGADYGEGTDLLAALRGLGGAGPAGDVPAELAELAAGGEFWKNCEEAIAREYAGLLVAVDFARFESEPAIVALVEGADGDLAVALTPACADGVIEPLAVQP